MANDEPQDELLLAQYGRCAICGAPRQGWEVRRAGITVVHRICTRDTRHGPDMPPPDEAPA